VVIATTVAQETAGKLQAEAIRQEKSVGRIIDQLTKHLP